MSAAGAIANGWTTSAADSARGGVVPALEVASELEARVVRRRGARLETAGWLGRAAGLWGEGSVVWLTQAGLSGVGLGGLAPVRASPAPSAALTAHRTVVAWSAVRAERRAHAWCSARELTVERDRWEIRVRDERGGRRSVLPDLAVWLKKDRPPAAIVIEPGYRREDRQRAILEGWQAAIHRRQYTGARYDCIGEPAAQRITRLARKVGLDRPVFIAVPQRSPAEIAAIRPVGALGEAQRHAIGGHGE